MCVSVCVYIKREREKQEEMPTKNEDFDSCDKN